MDCNNLFLSCEGCLEKYSGCCQEPIIPVRIEYVFDTSISTNLAIGDVRVYTVEHVLAALKAYQIDNLVIELTNLEPPVGNGSSDIFVQMIESAGIVEEDETIPFFWTSLGTQYCSFPVTADGFKSETASCSTLLYMTELSFLKDIGLIKGGSLKNAVIIQKDSVISKGGLFFPNEMVRHKILDLIGEQDTSSFFPSSVHAFFLFFKK
ncbi:hypothetical protein ACTFIW_008775 [Dictyostelium discoideum]